MRPLAFACLAGLCALAQPAGAGTRITVKTETYPVAGTSAEALLASMDRHGPRHGFLASALAQTRYAVQWQLDWSQQRGACRLAGADAALSITYRYPKASGAMPQKLARRWKRFLAGVRGHEETHGRIATQMVAAARKSALRVASAKDPGCGRAKAEVARRVKAVYADYERRQQKFDASEHRDGGAVDRLVASLIGG